MWLVSVSYFIWRYAKQKLFILALRLYENSIQCSQSKWEKPLLVEFMQLIYWKGFVYSSASSACEKWWIYLNNTQIKIVLNKRFIYSRVLNILTASTIALRNLWLVSVGPASTYWEERHFIASSSSSIAMSEMAYVLFMPSLY